MKKLAVLLLVFTQVNLSAQFQDNSCKFFNKISSSCEENLDSLLGYNFSKLLESRGNNTLGYIGSNYQRIKIRLISVVKDQNNEKEYLVFGKSKVKNNVCEFLGKIEIHRICLKNEKDRILNYNVAMQHEDEDAANQFKYPKGRIVAKYLFFEKKEQKGTGVFEGVLKCDFYIKDNIPMYDDLEKGYSDSYNNNQFVGKWISYKTNKTKVCNWGDYRVPYSKNLDVGIAEFSVNEKYLDAGWMNFYKAFLLQDLNAQKEEKNKWW
ncbi:hypothetical protein ACT3CE_04330 [Marinifilum sp. RC60d5]|uniref:hypothetical protein n=1 Tax=Marinifilum sp. RC60d5 TaxID=3458414 RepID=UPI0040365B93